MKKYMFIVPSLSNAGAERVCSILSNELVKRGEDVTILEFFKRDGEYPIDKKIKKITLSGGGEQVYKKMSIFERSRKIRKIIYDENPDCIIPFLRHINLQTYLFCKAKNRKNIIFTIRNSPYEKRGTVEKIHDYLINHKNKTIVQNQSQKDYFKSYAQNHIHIMSNPVDKNFLENERCKDFSCFTVISVGRVECQKNFPMLVRAFSDFAKDKNDVVLHIYGEGNDKDMIQDLIGKLGCGEKIKLMGRSNDLVSVYKEANLFILSSNFEGMPNALLEAMAIGLPCISTDCPTGPSEMIVSGENGLLVPVDDVEKMQEAIEFMYNNRDQAEKMGKSAREFVSENYRVENIVDRFLEIVSL